MRRRAGRARQALPMSGGRLGERHLRGALDGGIVVLVKWLFGEAHRTRDQYRRETLDRRIQVANGRVVIAPGALQFTLDIGELVLELQEVRIGLELGIGL